MKKNILLGTVIVGVALGSTLSGCGDGGAAEKRKAELAAKLEQERLEKEALAQKLAEQQEKLRQQEEARKAREAEQKRLAEEEKKRQDELAKKKAEEAERQRLAAIESQKKAIELAAQKGQLMNAISKSCLTGNFQEALKTFNASKVKDSFADLGKALEQAAKGDQTVLLAADELKGKFGSLTVKGKKKKIKFDGTKDGKIKFLEKFGKVIIKSYLELDDIELSEKDKLLGDKMDEQAKGLYLGISAVKQKDRAAAKQYLSQVTILSDQMLPVLNEMLPAQEVANVSKPAEKSKDLFAGTEDDVDSRPFDDDADNKEIKEKTSNATADIKPQYLNVEGIIKKSKRNNGYYYGDKHERVTYRIKLQNKTGGDLKGYRATMQVIGRHSKERKCYRILGRLDTEFSVENKREFQSSESEARTSYEKNINYKYGHKYYGYIITVYDDQGRVFRTKVSNSKLEPIKEAIAKMPADQEFNESGKKISPIGYYIY